MKRNIRVLAGLVTSAVLASSSMGSVYSDHFDSNRDYANNSLSGSIWGTRRFTAGGVADANITNPGVLTLTTSAGNSVGWDSLRDYGPYMGVINITGDFNAIVQVTSQIAANNSVGGLIARRSDSISSSQLHNAQEWFTTASYQQSATAANRALIATNMIGSGDTSNIAGNVYSSTIMTGTVDASAPIWLQLERIGNTFNAYYSTDGVNFFLGSSTERSDMNGYAVQVGLYYGLTGSGTPAGNIQFDNFSLVTIPEPASLALLALAGLTFPFVRRLL